MTGGRLKRIKKFIKKMKILCLLMEMGFQILIYQN